MEKSEIEKELTEEELEKAEIKKELKIVSKRISQLLDDLAKTDNDYKEKLSRLKELKKEISTISIKVEADSNPEVYEKMQDCAEINAYLRAKEMHEIYFGGMFDCYNNLKKSGRIKED